MSCGTFEVMPTDRPQIVAHRGASYGGPENTLAAFRMGFEEGADAIEGDFHLTADGEVVCHHDATTARCGNRDLHIARSSLKQLRSVDVGRWKSPKFAGERMPTLAEILAIVPRRRGIYIELKTGPEIVPFLVPILNASAMPCSRLVLMSFDPLTVLACKKVLPHVRTDWLTDFRRNGTGAGSRPTPSEILRTLRFCQADGIGMAAKLDYLRPALLQTLCDAGYGWGAWTVDDPDVARTLAARGAKSITTNRPGLLIDQLS
jgi:glycerophosphoryl diester phosphodiesterase